MAQQSPDSIRFLVYILTAMFLEKMEMRESVSGEPGHQTNNGNGGTLATPDLYQNDGYQSDKAKKKTHKDPSILAAA